MTRYLGRKRGIAVIPTLLTLGNGFCGFVAIAKALDAVLVNNGALFDEKILEAAWFIFLAMVFDALDGRVARLTHQTTEFGAQLDSFTDLISFGIAPAVLVKVIYEHTLIQAEQVSYSVKLTLMMTALYTVCAVLRLARYTVETSGEEPSHNTFVGMPTPGAAGMIAASVIFVFNGGETFSFMGNPALLLTLKKSMIFLPPLLGLLMISKIEYVHFFNRFVRGRKTFNFLVQGVLCIFIIAFWHQWAVFLCFALYLLSGPVLAVPRAVRTLLHRGDKRKHSPS